MKKQKEDLSYTLVYSTDSKLTTNCARCGHLSSECLCSLEVLLKGLKPNVRIERKGRGGKCVTVIERLPPGEKLLKDLSASLKKSMGCGGTWYLEEGQGFVELQGERCDETRRLLAALSHKD